jgi:YidC/Oxa1 family membrane protein insertase
MKQRNLILFLVGSMALIGLQVWLTPKPAPKAPAPQATAATPAQVPATASEAPAAPAKAEPVGPTVSARNENLTVTWSARSGAVVQAEWKDGTPLFPKDFLGLGGILATTFERHRVETTPEGTQVHFETAQGDHLAWTLPRAGHALQVTWTTSRGAHLRALPLPASLDDLKGLEAGRVLTLTDKHIQDVTWDSMLKDPFFKFLGAKRKTLPVAESRLGMDAGVEKNGNVRNHYFAAFWNLPGLPEKDAQGYHLAPVNGSLQAQLYLGPKTLESLGTFGAPFTQAVDYGFFGAVAKFFFIVLKATHKVLGNWGWAILVLSILLRLALWTPNTKQIISSLRMKEFEPHQKAIQAKYEKFGSDMTKKAEMQKELMELYKKNGFNPMGSCLPMLLQMPVFMALWSMLNNVFELRHAPWIFWVKDLSAKDPFFILPGVMALSTLVQSHMVPTAGDPQQAQMMKWMMPGMMLLMFSQAPAGLVLYYFMFNLVGLGQTWWTLKHYVPQPVKL